jgi:hypothetical protein
MRDAGATYHSNANAQLLYVKGNIVEEIPILMTTEACTIYNYWRLCAGSAARFHTIKSTVYTRYSAPRACTSQIQTTEGLSFRSSKRPREFIRKTRGNWTSFVWPFLPANKWFALMGSRLAGRDINQPTYVQWYHGYRYSMLKQFPINCIGMSWGTHLCARRSLTDSREASSEGKTSRKYQDNQCRWAGWGSPSWGALPFLRFCLNLSAVVPDSFVK